MFINNFAFCLSDCNSFTPDVGCRGVIKGELPKLLPLHLHQLASLAFLAPDKVARNMTAWLDCGW